MGDRILLAWLRAGDTVGGALVLGPSGHLVCVVGVCVWGGGWGFSNAGRGKTVGNGGNFPVSRFKSWKESFLK